MNTKMLREDIRTGQVERITIDQGLSGTFIFVYMRKTNNRFLLQRSFPAAVSALKAVEKMINSKPIAGLVDEYKRPPVITVHIMRRNQNETHQHEPQTEQKGIPEGQQSTSTE